MLSYLMPINDHESPKWVFGLSRALMSITILLLPFLYDTDVPEVAGDPRWVLIHLVTLFTAGLLFFGKALKPSAFSFKLPAVGWIMLILALSAIISMVDTISPIRSWWFLKHFLAYCGLFGLIYTLRHEKWYQGLLWLLVIPIFFNAVLAICQFFGITDANIPFGEYIGFIDYFRQAAIPGGTFSNKNLLASWLVLVLPIATYLFLNTKTHNLARWFSWSCLTLGLIALFYTRSRGSWVSFIAMLAFFGLWIAFNKTYRQAFIKLFDLHKLLMLAAILPIVTFASFQEAGVRAHSLEKTVSEHVASLSKIEQYNIRWAYNVNNLAVVADHPMNGTGIGSFHTIYPKYHDAIIPTPHGGYNVRARPQRAHNDVMQTFVELGLIGGFSFIGLFVALMFMTARLSKTEHIQKLGVLPLFIATGMAGLCLNALGDFPLQMPTAPALLWSSLGIMAGFYVLASPQNFKLEKPFFLQPAAAFLASAILFLTLFIIAYDDFKHREGAMKMRDVMAFTMARQFHNETILKLLEEALEIYPWNSRLQEYRGIIYTNYSGPNPIPKDDIIATLEDVLKNDPYAANNWINIGGLYHEKAIKAYQYGENDLKLKHAKKAIEAYEVLRDIAPDSYHTWILGGLAHLTYEDYGKAVRLLDKALEIVPNDPSATNGRNYAIQQLLEQGRGIGYISQD